MKETEMASAELREAAVGIRALAEAATPGPWGDPEDVSYGDFGWYVSGCPAGETADDEQGRADIRFIAAMHPVVALAVADLLDTAGADLWAHGPLCDCEAGCDRCDDVAWMPHVRRALVVARAFLGREVDQ